MRKSNRIRNVVLLAIDALPIMVPLALAAFGSIAILFLIIGQFKPAIIWPLGLIAAAASIFIIFRYYPRDVLDNRARLLCNILVVLGVLGWGGFNVLYTSQHVLVNRDPALYANAGIWLTKHDSLKIPTLHIFGSNVPGVRLDNGSGFKTVRGSNQQYDYAQGSHLLSAFLGLVGRIVGVANSLRLNVLFGMSALFGIYAFGRELVRRTWWAAVATGVVAASMPFIDVSRDSFSEPLAATFTFGGLALIWLALKCKKPSVWFLAGIVTGAGTMTRIDGYLSVAEILAFIAVMLALARKDDRVQTIRQSVALAMGMAVTSALGWLDISQLSTPYYRDLHSQFMGEALAVVACALLGVIAVWISWQTKLLSAVGKATESWRAEGGAIAVVGLAVILATRPFWYHPIDKVTGSLSYAQLTTEWVAWYIGPTFAVLGVVGIAMSTARALKKQQLFLTAGLLVVVGTSLLYLSQPNIAPDQIWASRRLVPVILPGVAVFAAMSLDWFSEQYMNKVKWGYVFAGLASVAILLAPLTTSKPLLRLRPYAELGGINSMCAVLPKDAAVLWVGAQPIQEIVQPTRSICNVPAQGYNIGASNLNRESLAQLASNARASHKVPVIGIYGNEVSAVPTAISGQLKSVSSVSIQDLEQTYLHAPENVTSTSINLELGRIQPDGSVVPLVK